MNLDNSWVFQYWGWNGTTESIWFGLNGKAPTREEAIKQGINQYKDYTDCFYIGKVESRKITQQERETDSLINEWCLKAEKDGITPTWRRVIDIEKIDEFTF